MPLTKVHRRISKICKRCRGAGRRLASASPLRYVPCCKCGGYGGRVIAPYKSNG